MSSPAVWTIVVAGGSGARFGGVKQFESLGRHRVIDRSVEIAARVSDGVVVVLPAEWVAAETERFVGTIVVAGGSTRSGSVRAGLAAMPLGVEVICVHDAARPLASTALYRRVIDAVIAGADGAIPGIPVQDTIKVVDVGGWVTATPDRASLRAVQTPQAFRASMLHKAHVPGAEATDDAALVESIGGRVVVVEGETDNLKLTVPSDLDAARERIAAMRPRENS